jgi:nitrogen regulatory protein PII-like uncharacterized protein
MAKRSFLSRITFLKVLNVLVILALAGAAGYYFKKYDNLKNSTPDKIQQAQTDEYIKAVGKLYSLPKNEKPDVATVKDKEALKKQYPFFDQAENGDVVLIYKDAKLAILYRPSTKQLVKVGPVNIESGVSIRVLGKEADRGAVEKKLTDNQLAFSKAEPKTAVTGITVVDVKGTNAEQAKKLAEIVGGQVGTLPAGEDKPTDVDLLVFVGAPTPVTP